MREILKLFDSNGADVGVFKNVHHMLTTTPSGRILEKKLSLVKFFSKLTKISLSCQNDGFEGKNDGLDGF